MKKYIKTDKVGFRSALRETYHDPVIRKYNWVSCFAYICMMFLMILYYEITQNDVFAKVMYWICMSVLFVVAAGLDFAAEKMVMSSMIEKGYFVEKIK